MPLFSRHIARASNPRRANQACVLDMVKRVFVCDDVESPLHGISFSVLEDLGDTARVTWLNPRSGEPNAGVFDKMTYDWGVDIGPETPTPPGACCINQDTQQIECADTAHPMHGASVISMVESAPGLYTVEWAQPGGPTRGTHLQLCEVPDEGMECCVDLQALQIVCPDTNHPWHGVSVQSAQVGDDGLADVAFIAPDGTMMAVRLPPCETPEGDCCYDAINGVILCSDPNHPLHNQPAHMSGEAENGQVYVCGHFDQSVSALQCLRLPLCPDRSECCYDAVAKVLVCDGHPADGQSPTVHKEGTDEAGNPYVIVTHPALNNGTRTLVYLCPDEVPSDCCYDMATGLLVCPGSPYDGLEVSLEYTTDIKPDGTYDVGVSHPDLPGGAAVFSICPQDTPGDCCYDGNTGRLVCPGGELDGTQAGVVATFTGPDGRTWVSVAWPGGGARVPLCTEECPPSFCCVNLDTGLFLCPGDPTRNGQAAPVQDYVTQNGFNFAQLADGTLVPVCGRECPPPELCPECPPGMWMTPDKECVDMPKCPPPGEECPPGMWRDPDGICRMPPECPPDHKWPPFKWPPHWWKTEGYCCESCGLGLACSGCGCGCGDSTGVPTHRSANPEGTVYPLCDSAASGRACVAIVRGTRMGVLLAGGRRYRVRVLETFTRNGRRMARILGVRRGTEILHVRRPARTPGFPYAIWPDVFEATARQGGITGTQGAAGRGSNPCGPCGTRQANQTLMPANVRKIRDQLSVEARGAFDRCYANCTGGSMALIGACVTRCANIRQKQRRPVTLADFFGRLRLR